MSASDNPAIHYPIDQTAGIVFVRFHGTLTFSHIASYAAALRHDPQFAPHFCEMVDISGVQSIALDPNDLMKLADHVDPFSPRSLRAFIASDPAQIHAASFHRVLRASEKNIRVFQSAEEARVWISSQPDPRDNARAKAASRA